MSDEMKAGEDKADIVTRLNAACIGHPHARIPWPHRLLHDARARIEELHTLLAEGLDLCVRARKLDAPVPAGRDGTGGIRRIPPGTGAARVARSGAK